MQTTMGLTRRRLNARIPFQDKRRQRAEPGQVICIILKKHTLPVLRQPTNPRPLPIAVRAPNR
jgi:hypothetical protein